MNKSNLAIRLLMGLGLGNVFNPGFAPPVEKRGRFGRNVGIRASRKETFNADAIKSRISKTHMKLQRKAALGELGLTGPRGLQARANPDGSLRITR